MGELIWIAEARRHLGTAEVPGPQTSPVIDAWLHKLRAWWTDDETPWCGVFVAACVEVAGFHLPKYWMRATAWADWGSRLSAPIYGCIVVFERKGGGHVGFVVGSSAQGGLMVLGGNQGNKVSILPFDRNRVLAYVWPPGVALPDTRLAELDDGGAALSEDEA